jgi:hypothetical protein
MRAEKSKVYAPEIARVWLNSPAVSLRRLRQPAVRVAFWDPVCAKNQPEWVRYRQSPELYPGHARGRIGHKGGFRTDRIADDSVPGKLREDRFGVDGHWGWTGESIESAGEIEQRVALKYQASGVTP